MKDGRQTELTLFLFWILLIFSMGKCECKTESKNKSLAISKSDNVEAKSNLASFQNATEELKQSPKYNVGDYNLPDLSNFFARPNQDIHMKKNKSSVQFLLYTPKCPDAQKLIVDKTNMSQTCFNSSQDLKVLIHGYTELGSGINSMVPIRIAYLRKQTEANVIQVDWTQHALDFYANSVKHLDEVTMYVTQLIDYIRMSTNYTDMSRIHMIGFSLGVHLCGLAGRHIFEVTGQKIGRITGLDPAGPKFFAVLTRYRVRLSDAEFVDFIHGDTETYGGNFLGHANFYPNGGKRQPGCGTLMNIIIGCGHRKTPQWFTESILEPRKFIGCRCTNYELYLQKNCTCNNRDELAVLGEHCSPKARGMYFLITRNGDTNNLNLGIYPNSISLGLSTHVQINDGSKSINSEIKKTAISTHTYAGDTPEESSIK